VKGASLLLTFAKSLARGRAKIVIRQGIRQKAQGQTSNVSHDWPKLNG
jgi:hypothetical protein